MTQSVVNQIAEDIDDVFDEVVKSLKKMTRHLGEDTGDALSNTAVALSRSTVDLIESAKAQSKSLATKAGKEIREHPAETAAIAAAAVALIGLAISQRKQKAD